MPPLLRLAERAAWLRHRPVGDVALVQRQRRARCPAAAAATGVPSAAANATPCLFDTLGVRRTADREEIKAAFRRLAQKWHPDVNAAPDAAERFQAISRAFRVLSDEQQRHQYERARFGAAAVASDPAPANSGDGGGGRAQWPRERLPPDVLGVLRVGFRQAALGAQQLGVVVEVVDACGQCHGTGGQPGTPSPPCSMCKGRGEIERRLGRAARGAAADGTPGQAVPAVVCCPVCAGRGFSITKPCSCCAGAGLTAQPRRLGVRLPAGVDTGSRLTVAGEGSVCRAGGPRGAVLLEVQVAEEAGLWRQGLDVHSDLAVPLWDALLGGTTTVATLRGAARLAIPPGTQHGAVLSVPRAGVHPEAAAGEQRRGAHRFQVSVQLPRQVSGAEQALLLRLAELQHERRRHRQAC